MDHMLSDVTVSEFRLTMLKAADVVHIVSPAELREPLTLWFTAAEECCRVEN